MKEVIVMYVQCERCGEKECHVKENRKQGVIKDKIVWMSKEKGKRDSMPHKGKSTAKWCTTRRVRKCSKREG